MNHLDYEDRIKALRMFSIYGRLLWADIIKGWKIFHEIADVGLQDSFNLAFDRKTHGHSFKVVLPRCDLEMRKRFFNVRAIQNWYSLSIHTLMKSTLSSFKSVLDLELGDALYAVL